MKAEIKIIRETVALLDSMVRGREHHSETSVLQGIKYKEAIDKLEAYHQSKPTVQNSLVNELLRFAIWWNSEAEKDVIDENCIDEYLKSHLSEQQGESERTNYAKAVGACNNWMPDKSTSATRCANCGKDRWDHEL